MFSHLVVQRPFTCADGTADSCRTRCFLNKNAEIIVDLKSTKKSRFHIATNYILPTKTTKNECRS